MSYGMEAIMRFMYVVSQIQSDVSDVNAAGFDSNKIGRAFETLSEAREYLQEVEDYNELSGGSLGIVVVEGEGVLFRSELEDAVADYNASSDNTIAVNYGDSSVSILGGDAEDVVSSQYSGELEDTISAHVDVERELRGQLRAFRAFIVEYFMRHSLWVSTLSGGGVVYEAADQFGELSMDDLVACCKSLTDIMVSVSNLDGISRVTQSDDVPF